MPSETLLPCPFCGGKAELWKAYPGDAVWPKRTAFVGCMGECATVVTRGFETDAEAIATWNRRAAHQERDADARRLDWLEGWMQDGCFQMDMMDLCYGSDSVRAAIDAAMAPWSSDDS